MRKKSLWFVTFLSLLFFSGVFFATEKVFAAALYKVTITKIGTINGSYLNIYANSFPQDRLLDKSDVMLVVRFSGTPSGRIVFSVNGIDLAEKDVRELDARHDKNGSTRLFALSFAALPANGHISSLYVTARDHVGQQYFDYLNGIKIKTN